MKTFAERLRRLKNFGRLSAPKVAQTVRKTIEETASKGQTPDGEPWKPTKAGTPPLRNAVSKLDVGVLRDMIVVQLTGHYARHSKGWVKGGIARKIIPNAPDMPRVLSQAIEKEITRQLSEIVRDA